MSRLLWVNTQSILSNTGSNELKESGCYSGNNKRSHGPTQHLGIVKCQTWKNTVYIFFSNNIFQAIATGHGR